MTGIPLGIEDVTAAWLSSVLGEQVDDARVELVGEGVGFLGCTALVSLRHRSERLPDSLFVKLPAEGPARQIGIDQRLYEREVRFYGSLAPTVGIRVPRCHLALMDLEAGRFVVLLEDLSGCRLGDQAIGATDDDVLEAVEVAARLHAAWWGAPALGDLDWLPTYAGTLAMMVDRAPGLWPAFADAWRGELRDDELALGERLMAGTSFVVEGATTATSTLVHGDYRLDNLFFTDDGEVIVGDWQLVMRGPSGVADLALLLASSLDQPTRARLLPEVVDRYLDALRRHGVVGYGHDALRHDLAVAAGGLILRCPIAHQIPSPNERAKAMRRSLFRGYWDLAEFSGLAEHL